MQSQTKPIILTWIKLFVSRCALLPPFSFFIGPSRSSTQGASQHRSATHCTASRKWHLLIAPVRILEARRAVCTHGTMRVERLGISQFTYEPGVFPALAAAPMPFSWGDKGRGTAHLVVSDSLLAFRITVPERASRTVCAHGTMRVGCLGILEFIHESRVLLILAAAPAPSSWDDINHGLAGRCGSLLAFRTSHGTTWGYRNLYMNLEHCPHLPSEALTKQVGR